MKKIFFIAILLLAGCEFQETREPQSMNGVAFHFGCIDGKEFVITHTSLSINLDMDGKPIPCKENTNA